MEIKICDYDSPILSEFLGFDGERLEYLAFKNSKRYAKFLEDFIFDKDFDESSVNVLLSKLIEDCESIEEVVYICCTFRDNLNAIMNNFKDKAIIESFAKHFISKLSKLN